MTRKIIALDIRKDRVFALFITNSLKGNLIEAVTEATIEPSHSGSDSPGRGLEAAIEKVVGGFDPSGAEFLVSISPELVSYRNLRIPFKDRKKIRQVLPFEIEPALPFPIEDVVISFQTVRQADQTDIIAGIVRTSDLEIILAALKKQDIDPQIVTPGGLSTAVYLSKLSNFPQQFIFIDFNHINCSLFAVASGHIHLARTFQTMGTDPSDKSRTVVKNILQFLAAFESFYDFEFDPSLICISGIDDELEVFKQAIDRAMSVSVKSIDLLNEVQQNTRLSDGIQYSPVQFNSVLGLAVAEISGFETINFYGERSILKRYWEENKNDIIKTGFLSTVVFICFMFNLLLEAHDLDQSIRQLNQQITSIFQTTFPDVAKIVDPVQQMRQMIQEAKGKSNYAAEIEENIPNIDILNEISQLIPDQIDVEITQFVRGEDNILISGDTNTFNAVDEVKGKLEKSKYFKTITINSANMDNASNRVQFKIKIDI